MNSKTFTRQELYTLVWSMPIKTLAKKYSISEIELRKTCLKMNIPLPTTGHWMKIQFKKPVEIIELSPNYSGEQEITLALQLDGDNSKRIQLEKKIISKNEEDVIVPDRLTNPDKLIIDARELLTRKNDNAPNEMLYSYGKSISIRVTKENIGRALRFMDTFVKVMRKRGHQILLKNNLTYIVIQGEEIEIHFWEKNRRTLNNDERSWPRYIKVPTGILSFNARAKWKDTEWKDGRLPIEHQLAKIIAKLEMKGEELKQQRIEREKYWAEQREIKRIAEELEERKEEEIENFQKLLQASKQWQEANVVRAYISEIEANALSENKITIELENWILWARMLPENKYVQFSENKNVPKMAIRNA